ncbi:MAG: radical SAM protein [Phycisphaerae bacterium]
MRIPLSTFKLRAGGPKRVKYIRSVDQIPGIPPDERAKLKRVAERYVFRANDYYLELIDWEDPADPIKRIIIPREEELADWGELDASNEQAITVARGVQHKYPHTVLLLCNEVCGAYCRYCFRKRLFMDDNDEVTNDLSEGLAYIAENPNVSNVLLTGGDPLLMSTRRLVEIIEALRAISHVEIIRIGSKLPAFDPWRLLNDPELQKAFRVHSTPRKRIYLMAHFDHPRELTDAAIEGIDCFIRNGVICTNQCPVIKGVNDDADVLATMFRLLSYIGCPPYYLFQGRPTAGNEAYKVPIVRGWEVFSEALRRGSGLARRARFVMSHETGKIEILAVDDNYIYFRYHRAKDPAMRGQFMIYKRNDDAAWLDELEPAEGFDAPKFPPSPRFDVVDGPE